MDIAGKLKDARIRAGLTQEQTAQALGVSRQTISNWENGRTYPDIVSVIHMSDLFRVSLDVLLKGERSGYIDYLEESTDMAESKRRHARLALVVTYLAIWSVAVLIFWCFTSGSDAMGYSLMCFYFLLPVSTLVFSLFIGRGSYWGRRDWLAPVFFGLMLMLAEYATFSVANMAFNEFSRGINPPEAALFFFGAAIALAGVAAGRLLRRFKG